MLQSRLPKRETVNARLVMIFHEEKNAGLAFQLYCHLFMTRRKSTMLRFLVGPFSNRAFYKIYMLKLNTILKFSTVAVCVFRFVDRGAGCLTYGGRS